MHAFPYSTLLTQMLPTFLHVRGVPMWYGLPVIGPCNYRPVITAVITVITAPCFPVTCNWSFEQTVPAFRAFPPCQAEVAAEQDPHARYTLRRGNEAISSSRMSPKMARKQTRTTRRKPTVRMESRMQRVRTERRELHSAVGSERCAGQSPTASQSPQSLRYSM